MLATPVIMENKTVLGTERRPVMGFVGSSDPRTPISKQFALGDASFTAVSEIVFVIDRTAHYVRGLFSGRERADQLSGPTRIAYISGKVGENRNLDRLLVLAAILSISIGLINLLPVPMLDGGHLVFYAIEAIFGRPVSPRAQEISFRVGFAMVLGLMLFSTWNDIVHLTGICAPLSVHMVAACCRCVLAHQAWQRNNAHKEFVTKLSFVGCIDERLARRQ